MELKLKPPMLEDMRKRRREAISQGFEPAEFVLTPEEMLRLLRQLSNPNYQQSCIRGDYVTFHHMEQWIRKSTVCGVFYPREPQPRMHFEGVPITVRK